MGEGRRDNQPLCDWIRGLLYRKKTRVGYTVKLAENLWSGNPQGAEPYAADPHLAALALHLVSLIF